MIPAAVYARVSTDAQDRSESIQTQLQFAERWAPAHGYEIVDRFLDAGVSGTVPVEQRPKGVRLLQEARQGRFRVVLVYQVDRLGRDPVVVLNAVQELAAAGVRVQSMQEAFDERDPMGRFLLTLFSSIGRLVRDQTIARSIEGSARVAREGAWLGGEPPYGYRVLPQGRATWLMPNEEPLPGSDLSEAEVIRRMYRWYVDGWSSVEIARHLHSLGLRLRAGYAASPPLHRRTGQPVKGYWTAAQVVTLLARSTYKGEHVYGKRGSKEREPITRPVPPLVDEALWEAARKRAQANHRNARRNTQRVYLLRGLLRCGWRADADSPRCGRMYQGNTQQRYSYYLCASYNISAMRRHYEPESRPCRGHVLRQAKTEAEVWGMVWGVIQHPERIRGIYTEFLSTLPQAVGPNTADLEAVERALVGCDAREKNVDDAVEQGYWTVTEARQRKAAIHRERMELRERLKALQPVSAPSPGLVPEFEALALKAQADLTEGDTPEKRRRWIEEFIREIRVEWEGRKAVFHCQWRFCLSG